jgi:hypothetical protein
VRRLSLNELPMDLYLRKVEHGQHSPRRFQHSAGAQYTWKWAIDTVIPMRTHQTQGRGTDRPTACGSSRPPGRGLRLTRPT